MAKSKYKEKEKEKEKPTGPKSRNDAYVMLLFITFLAIVIGCVLIYLDNEEYGGKPAPKEPVPTPSKLGESDTKGSDAGAIPKGDTKTAP